MVSVGDTNPREFTIIIWRCATTLLWDFAFQPEMPRDGESGLEVVVHTTELEKMLIYKFRRSPCLVSGYCFSLFSLV